MPPSSLETCTLSGWGQRNSALAATGFPKLCPAVRPEPFDRAQDRLREAKSKGDAMAQTLEETVLRSVPLFAPFNVSLVKGFFHSVP